MPILYVEMGGAAMGYRFAQTHNPKRVRAQTFFEYVCPTLMSERADLCRQLGGRYSFRLYGSGGGAWTLDFAALRIEPKASPADLEVTMRVEDFEAMMEGTLDVANAIADEMMVFEGERALFENLAKLTTPAMSARPHLESKGA